MMGLGLPIPAVASRALIGAGGGAEAAAFLARTTGLDALHVSAYISLIDGLVADAIWSKLDVLYIFATQNRTTALLNLVSTDYNGTEVSAPTFTIDRGYTGTFGPKTITIGFNPTTAVSPEFTRNSAHTMGWSVTDVGVQGTGLLGYSISGNEAAIIPRYTDGNAYFRTNSSATAGQAVPSSQGFFLGNRSSATAVQGYRNGSLIMNHTSSDNSVPVQNATMAMLGLNINGNVQECLHQLAAASIGSSLSGTDVGNYYNRLRAYMTAVGVP